MDKQIEALKLALEALEVFEPKTFIGSDAELLCRAAITAIREALAQPAPPPECQTEAEKTAFAFGWWKALEQKRKADSALDRMADNARELGLDYEPIVERVENSVGMGHKAWDMVEPKELAKAFHEALAERNRIWNQEDWTEYERGIAAAAKAEENEACAQFLESTQLGSLPDDTALHYARLLKGFAEGIRARGQS